ncbi:MAG: DUF1838 family protein [Sphingomonas sp.]
MTLMKLALLATATVACTLGTAASARMLDPAVPADAFEISKRVQCGEADGKPAVYHFAGKIYSKVEGEPDRLLFFAEGMNVRQCVAVEDPKRGKGYRLVSREVLFYLDPKTGEVLRQWTNPWTNETVDVMHIHNDPVNSRPNFPIGADGKPASFAGRREGKWLFMSFEAPLFYENPLAGAYQDYIGGKYHAMEIFDFVADANDMLDTKNATSYPSVSWVRISDWMPWMKQRGRQGNMIFNAIGSKVHSFDELPTVMKDEIAKNYPIWTAPPPGDDPRPNATTWTVFKAQIDAERAAKGK